MEPAWAKGYTEEDYYNLPEEVRAELIDGQFYYMAAPSRIHQKIFFNKLFAGFRYLFPEKGRIIIIRPMSFLVLFPSLPPTQLHSGSTSAPTRAARAYFRFMASCLPSAKALSVSGQQYSTERSCLHLIK